MRRPIRLALATLVLTAMQAQAADKTIRIVNRASEEILFVLVKNPEDVYWGDDLLTDTLWRGRSAKVVVSDGIRCERNLRAIARSGRAAELQRVDVCKMTEWKIEDRSLR